MLLSTFTFSLFMLPVVSFGVVLVTLNVIMPMLANRSQKSTPHSL